MIEETLNIAFKFVSVVLSPLIGWVFWIYRGLVKEQKTLLEQNQKIERRLNAAEASLAQVPSTQAIHELGLLMERLSGDMRTLDARLEGTDTAVNKLDQIVTRQETFLLNKKRGPR